MGRAEVQDEQRTLYSQGWEHWGVQALEQPHTGDKEQHLLISFRRLFKAHTWQRGMSSALSCVWYLLEARLRNNPLPLPGSHEQRICSPSDRLGTLCEPMRDKGQVPLPARGSEVLSRSTLCCSVQAAEGWVSTKGLSTKAKHPNSKI